ncbi:MAG: competence/damage-inducible protein A, partial [Candidatus Actinomarinales bacterium]
MNVGTEILIGDTLNTNGNALSRILLSHGFILHYDLSVADDKDDVASALKFLTL